MGVLSTPINVASYVFYLYNNYAVLTNLMYESVYTIAEVDEIPETCFYLSYGVSPPVFITF